MLEVEDGGTAVTATLEPRTSLDAVPRQRTRASDVRRFVGGFYLVMGGINAGIVAADAATYRTFADGSFWPFVTDTWRDVVMAHPVPWLLALAAGEVVLGLLLLRGGAGARVGWTGVIVFHVLLMSFGLGFWLWSVPALLVLVPAARSDWPALGVAAPATNAPAPGTPPSPPLVDAVTRTTATLVSTWVLATAVVAASFYGLLAETPYRSLPEATVVSARAQDACSIVVAALLVLLVRRPVMSVAAGLARLGLLAYLLYSYLDLRHRCADEPGLPGLRPDRQPVRRRPARRPPAHPRASTRLHRVAAGLTRTTGWVLVVTAVLFAGLWLSVLVPYALGGSTPDPEGVGGTPYPVFVLDLAVVLPAIAAVGVLLLRGRAVAGALAAVAMLKILTLFTALWAGPLLALATDADVHLGPDAVPSLLLLAASAWLTDAVAALVQTHPQPPPP